MVKKRKKTKRKTRRKTVKKRGKTKSFAGMGYCLKCRKKVKIKNPRSVTKKKRRFLRGVCPKCGIAVWRITGKK